MLNDVNVLAGPGHAVGVASLVGGSLPLLGPTDQHDWEVLPTLGGREGDSLQLGTEGVTHHDGGSSVDTHADSVTHASYAIKSRRQENLFLPLKGPTICYMYAANCKQIGGMA
jgi:hypothetical protein